MSFTSASWRPSRLTRKESKVLILGFLGIKNLRLCIDSQGLHSQLWPHQTLIGDSLSSGPPQATKSSLLQFAPRSSIHDDTFAFARRAPATYLFAIRSVANVPQKKRHGYRAQDREAEDAYHDQSTLPILLPALASISRPTLKKSVRRQYRAQITEAGDQSRSSCYAHLSMPWLEDLIGPCHGDGYGRSKPEPNEQQTAISRPWIGDAAGVRRHQ